MRYVKVVFFALIERAQRARIAGVPTAAVTACGGDQVVHGIPYTTRASSRLSSSRLSSSTVRRGVSATTEKIFWCRHQQVATALVTTERSPPRPPTPHDSLDNNKNNSRQSGGHRKLRLAG